MLGGHGRHSLAADLLLKPVLVEIGASPHSQRPAPGWSPEDLHAELVAHFAPHHAALEELIGCPLGW